MKLEMKHLEEYECMSSKQLKAELFHLQAELADIPDAMENDVELQKAVELVNSRRAPYTAKKRQLTGVIKTIQMICRQRGLTNADK